jgi:hypothetical protein
MPPIVMAMLVAAIHAFLAKQQDVDGRNKSGHDAERLAHQGTVDEQEQSR